MSTYFLRNAIEDFRYLLTRGYPQAASVKLVGDRYRLSRTLRNALFRGVMAPALAASRQARVVPPEAVAGLPLGVDWFNVLITAESYLKGLAVFVCDDGMVRDSAGVHGSYQPGTVTEQAQAACLAAIETLESRGVWFYLDSPVSHSGDMARALRAAAESSISRPTVVEVVRSADYELKAFRGVVASSDSAIMDRAGAVVDLPRVVIEATFGNSCPPLHEINAD